MEPRPHERGKLRSRLVPADKSTLQWSHVLTNVESALSKDTFDKFIISFNGATSSRTWKDAWETLNTLTPRASMEPRPHERGKTIQRVRRETSSGSFNGATSSRTWKVQRASRKGTTITSLQWSHVLTNVERRAKSSRNGCGKMLQWSHVLTNVERPQRAWPSGQLRMLQWSHVLTNVESIPKSKTIANG